MVKQRTIWFPEARGATREYVAYIEGLADYQMEIEKAWDYKVCVEMNFMTYENWVKEGRPKK